jgi:DNA polymerase-3 subunit delta'
MDFDGIIGQKQVVGSLKRAFAESRIPHAYIFTGPAGIGKKTIAHLFAGLLLCENPQSGAACGLCHGCLLYENGSNPDYRRINTEEASIGVDMIRGIQGDVSIRPMYSKRKVYIIEDAGKMTDQAQNCLLKTFEEPPQYVVVILLAANYEMLLETIRSRAQRLNFTKYTYEQVCQALAEKYGRGSGSIGGQLTQSMTSPGRMGEQLTQSVTSPGSLELAAGYADGNIGLALELAASGEFTLLREKTIELLAGVAKGRMEDILEFTAFMEENKDSAELLIGTILLYYRDLLVVCETGNEKMLINSDKKDIIFNNARMYRSSRLLDNITAIEATRRALKQNANYQLAIDNMLIKLREV